MTEFLLIIFAAGIIYFVATRMAPQNLMFRVKKDPTVKPSETKIPEEQPQGSGQGLISEGQALFNKGDYEKAEKVLILAIKEDHKASQAYHFLGMIYLRQKEYAGAVEALEAATRLDPLNDTAFNNLGLSYFNTEDYEKAVLNIEKSIALNDSIGHRYTNLALAYQKLKNLEKAAVALENAVKIHSNVENLTLLAKNYQEMKDKKLALKSIERLLEIDPQNPWAKRQLASLKH
jgi:tetratricopeptide (TPR) repeat protein